MTKISRFRIVVMVDEKFFPPFLVCYANAKLKKGQGYNKHKCVQKMHPLLIYISGRDIGVYPTQSRTIHAQWSSSACVLARLQHQERPCQTRCRPPRVWRSWYAWKSARMRTGRSRSGGGQQTQQTTCEGIKEGIPLCLNILKRSGHFLRF